LVQFATIPLYVISALPQLQSLALDNILQSAVFAEFQILVQYVKLLAVGDTLLNVYVANNDA
jgi:hypothetical protein